MPYFVVGAWLAGAIPNGRAQNATILWSGASLAAIRISSSMHPTDTDRRKRRPDRFELFQADEINDQDESRRSERGLRKIVRREAIK